MPNISIISSAFSRRYVSPGKTKYNLANTIFNAQKIFGPFCTKCQLKYFAFRVYGTNNYLTAQFSNLVFQASTNPTSQQLF